MGRWSRGSGVILMGGILFNGGCATAPPCPVPHTLPAVVAQPLPTSSSLSVGLEQHIKIAREAHCRAVDAGEVAQAHRSRPA
jgi:hypothetical protein